MEELTKKQRRKLKKRDEMLVYGLKHKLIFPYPDILFDYLRPYCVGGFPCSIMLFINELCNGHCYDRAELMSLAFDDCQIIHANIESLRITDGKKLSEHAFVETSEFGSGKTWVVDTSIGLIFDKKYYYKLEKPKINRIIKKEEIMKSYSIKQILASNFNEDKYSLPITLPLIENAIERSNHIGTKMYKDKVIEELKIFKQAIGYNEIVAEIDADLKIMRKDPDALDEKFQIKRDKYGREISRRGKPNPYYISPAEIDAQEKYLESIKNDKEKVKEFCEELHERTRTQMKIEEKEILDVAQETLEKIKKNPTMNFYERDKK